MSVVDPIEFGRYYWPHVKFYRQQREIIYSVRDNIETFVVAGNMLGKDYVAGFLVLWFFMTRHPCRIVTTSAKEDHLRVLWGEVGKFIDTAVRPLTVEQGGSLIVNHQEIRKVVNGEKCKISYVIGRVASQDKIAAMQGHHVAQTGDGVPRTFFVADECSSVPQAYYVTARTWANRMFLFGNPWECNNFFKFAVKGEPGTKDKGGDILSADGMYYDRKVIQIAGKHSPNVRLAEAQIRAGKEPTNKIIIPGVKPYAEYLRNRKRWNLMEQCVGLDAEFYEGKEIKLFPKDWLELAEKKAAKLPARRRAKAIGVDSAYGRDDTSWAGVDDEGLIAQNSKKTPDTSIIVPETLIFMRDMGLTDSRNVLFDAGGGGQVHVDNMRKAGYKVRAIAFGGAPTAEKQRRQTMLEERIEQDEIRYIYTNRRAEMYWALRLQLDPMNGRSFGLPTEILDAPRLDGKATLREQLLAISLDYDGEGRLYVAPKDKKSTDPEDKPNLTSIIGCSPDQLDSLILAVFGLVERRRVFVIKPA